MVFRDFKNMSTYSKKKRKSKRGCLKFFTSCLKKSLNWFHVYCKNTSLHGFRYISINGSVMIEHIFWFVICILAFMFCIILMLRLWENYSKNPIVTIIDTSNPIWELSFPAVTICNNNKVYRPHADIIAENLYMNGFSTDQSDELFSSLAKLIRPDKVSNDNITSSQVLDNLNVTVETLMLQLMQPCSSLLVRCAWIGKIQDCNKIFKTVMSREGFCCAFNSHYYLNVIHNNNTYDSQTETRINFTEINPDDALNVSTILKVPGSGRDLGLTVALNIEGAMYKAPSRPYVGATVLINEPIDFPDIGTQIAPVKPGHVLAISVAGFYIRSMDSMRNISPEKRKCFFEDEKPGEVRYSYQSCMSECIANHTYRNCQCLPFYYPEKHDGIRTCYLPDLNCLLTMRKLTADYSKLTCAKCLPQCSDMTYTINIENVQMDEVGYDSNITRGLDIHNISFLYVYFGDLSYVEYRKENILSWDTLLASFGGIFGLCLGGSVLSVIELVYLLARQILKRQLRERPAEQSLANLPPASEIFLVESIPVEKIQRPARDQQGTNDKRVFVTWQQSTLQQRGATMKHDVRRKRGKL